MVWFLWARERTEFLYNKIMGELILLLLTLNDRIKKSSAKVLIFIKQICPERFELKMSFTLLAF